MSLVWSSPEEAAVQVAASHGILFAIQATGGPRSFLLLVRYGLFSWVYAVHTRAEAMALAEWRVLVAVGEVDVNAETYLEAWRVDPSTLSLTGREVSERIASFRRLN